MFDVSMETMGLFATCKASEDLVAPKNAGRHSQNSGDVDIIDYIMAKNSSTESSTLYKMEYLLSSMYGILEVEPLEFICSSMSDGCKVENHQGGGEILSEGGGNGAGSLYCPSTSVHPVIAMSSFQDHYKQLQVISKYIDLIVMR